MSNIFGNNGNALIGDLVVSGGITNAALSSLGSTRINSTHTGRRGKGWDGAEDCPLSFALTDIECLSGSAVEHLVDNRNPIGLNSSGQAAEEDTAAMGLTTALANIKEIARNKAYSGFILAKVKYIADCSVNGVQFTSPYGDTYPLAVFSSVDGQAGAASDQFYTFFRSDVQAAQQRMLFMPRRLGGVAPSSVNPSLFCWVLFAVANPDFNCPASTMVIPLQNVLVTKPEWVDGNINLDSAQIANNGVPPAGNVAWNAALQGMMYASIFVVSGVPVAPGSPQVAAALDINSDAEMSIVDIVGYITLLQMIASGDIGAFDVNNLPPFVPQLCCDDAEDIPDMPDDPKNPGNGKPINCEADMKIITVRCVPSSVDTAAEKLGSNSTMPDNSTSFNREDCDDDETIIGSGLVDMYILVGIRNDLTVAGVQFDVGWNKLSSVPLENIEVGLYNPNALQNNWNISHLPYEDRYGYDRGVRVITFQPLLSATGEDGTKTYGFDANDDNVIRGLQTLPSLGSSLGRYQPVALIRVKNVSPTACPCPKRSFRITGNIDNIQNKNIAQRRHPELFERGKDWEGAVIRDGNTWYTAQTPLGGPPVRDESSLQLQMYWEGVDLNNMRIVTNEQTRKPFHQRYGLKYIGDYHGMLAQVPVQFNNFQSYFNHFVLKLGVTKALYNGLNLDINGHRDVSKYEAFWQHLLGSYINSLTTLNGSPFNAAQITQIVQSFDKGFADDATLDGKFDVADIVALTNSAQFRMLLPVNAASIESGSWRNIPTDWSGAVDQGMASSAGDDAQFSSAAMWNPQQGSNSTPTSSNQIPNLGKIVPAYCLDTICTSTMSDLCPDICGNAGPESPSTITKNSKATVLTGFSQRVDILPLKAATLSLVFSKKPNAGSEMTLIDWKEDKEVIRFVGSGSTGDALDNGIKAVRIGANLDATIVQIASYFSSHTTLGITCSTLPTGAGSGRNGVILTQSKPGNKGNKKVKLESALNLINYKTAFTGGSTHRSNLPTAYRNWSEYFRWQNGIFYKDLYYNEEEYGASGASFFELHTRISPYYKITSHWGYIGYSISTLNFCHAYNSSDPAPKVKVLPGDGFSMVDVYDFETGALLSPNASDPLQNFYSVPTHGKIILVSHNYKFADGVNIYNDKGDISDKTSEFFTPITQDGGKVVSAKIFVTPMPDWESGKYIELLSGSNEVSGSPNGKIASSLHPIGPIFEKCDTSYPAVPGPAMLVGPKTSQFSQYYYDDSSSLHTYADYMLHAKIMAPNHVRVKYNTMKPFKYVKFAIRSHNSAEVEKVSLVNNPLNPDNPTFGWEVKNHFHENVAEVDGLPLEPSQYAGDGYNVITLHITGSYQDESNNWHYGVANPTTFNKSGDLCDIYFKNNLFSEFPISGKEYICPPIGHNNYSYPPRQFESYSSYVDDARVGNEKSYPEGSSANKKHVNDDLPTLIGNFDSETTVSSQAVTQTVSSTVLLNKWISTPGTIASAHQGTAGHRPQFNTQGSDKRSSVYFNGGMGLSTPSSGTGYRSADIHKWSIYTVIRPDETLSSSMDHSAPADEAVIFSVGGNGTTQMKLTLKLVKVSGSGNFSLVATSQGRNAGGGDVSTALTHSITSASPLNGWHQIAWIGDSEAGTVNLYIDGKSVANGTLTHSTALGEHGIQWYIGHDGTQATIGSTIGDPAAGKPWGGRMMQLMMYSEAHDENEKQTAEAYLGKKYSLDTQLDSTHPYYNDGKGSGIDVKGYLSLNRTDREIERASQHIAAITSTKIDLGSDRCAASWVSDHICLDKYAQTLLNISCEGSGADYFLGS